MPRTKDSQIQILPVLKTTDRLGDLNLAKAARTTVPSVAALVSYRSVSVFRNETSVSLTSGNAELS
jgi:hypothetical protein